MVSSGGVTCGVSQRHGRADGFATVLRLQTPMVGACRYINRVGSVDATCHPNALDPRSAEGQGGVGLGVVGGQAGSSAGRFPVEGRAALA